MILQSFFIVVHEKKKQNSKPASYVNRPLSPTIRFLICRIILKITEVNHTLLFY